eukprot:GFUD01033961.1.p1 GENE.GFUD01033961.1~~GFUD01033961.1.p1  ORF type:complete len:700 (+),score=234.52 GFUD01033961.1:60-2159(+)
MESAQVSRLLELAAAMSSAQEKATGNAKLDMAGIMAALTMAQNGEMISKTSWQGGEDAGQSSFLHGRYQSNIVKKSSSSSLVRAEYVSETMCEETETVGRRNVEIGDTDGRNKSFLHHKDELKKCSQSENIEQGKEIGSNLTGIQVFSKKLDTFKSNDKMSFLNKKDSNEQRMENTRNIKGRETNEEKMDAKIKNPLNKSFLHNEGDKVNASWRDNETQKLGNNVAGYKAAFESINSEASSSASSSGNSPKSYKKLSTTLKTVTNYNGQNNPSVPSLSSSHGIANFLTMKKDQKLENNEHKEEIRNEETRNENKIFLQKNTTNKIKNLMEAKSEESKEIFGISNRKALFEQFEDQTANKTDHQNYKTNSKENSSTSSGLHVNINKEHKTETPDLEKSLPLLLDSSDSQVSKFLATVSQLSSDKERQTGNGKLDMAELVAALSSVTGDRDTKDENTLEKRVTSRDNILSRDTKFLNASHTNYIGKARMSANDTCNKKQSIESNYVTSGSSCQNNSTIQTLNQETNSKMESTYSHSQKVTSSSITKEFDTKKASFGKTPSNLDNAKTSFLQSQINQTKTDSSVLTRGTLVANRKKTEKTNNVQSKTLPKSPAFVQQKNSVIGELKNILDDEPTPTTNTQQRTFNSTPAGFQAAKLSAEDLTAQYNKPGAPTQISSTDPVVKKIVYSQYREMLKSYSSTNKV